MKVYYKPSEVKAAAEFIYTNNHLLYNRFSVDAIYANILKSMRDAIRDDSSWVSTMGYVVIINKEVGDHIFAEVYVDPTVAIEDFKFEELPVVDKDSNVINFKK